MNKVKFNLGCGNKKLDGYTNCDKFGNPDVKFDLEVFPWPVDDDYVDEILMVHVLEHLGQTKECFIGVLKELYRICKNGAEIKIIVPHYNHDNFKSDPTHVRIITPETLHLFDKSFNNECIKNGYSNSTLGLDYDLDFKTTNVKYHLDPQFKIHYYQNKDRIDLNMAMQHYNNVISEIEIHLEVVK